MKKSHKGLLILLVPFVLGFLIGFLAGGGFSEKSRPDNAEKVEKSFGGDSGEEMPEQRTAAAAPHTEVETVEEDDDDVDGLGAAPKRKEVIYYRNRLQYSKLFADLNDAHLEAARRLGLKEIPRNRSDVEHSRLVKIEDNDWLVVDDLKYSVPYLTEGAAKELNRIGKAFCDSLKSKNLLDYKIIVSSLLRTEEDVQRLRRSGNPNASNNSAHCYATTFDITYTRYWAEDESEAFMQPFELTKVLGEVLLDEKKAGRVLVKYERKEHCFHITAL